jgi:hypothetical protein
MTMDQAVYVTPITQGAIFGFPPYGERSAADVELVQFKYEGH